jgi:hypothetical protein
MLDGNSTTGGIDTKRSILAERDVVVERGNVVAESGAFAERSIIAKWCGIVAKCRHPSVALLLPSGATWRRCRQAERCGVVAEL